MLIFTIIACARPAIAVEKDAPSPPSADQVTACRAGLEDAVITACTPLIDNAATLRDDRLAALLRRARALAPTNPDRAIADYTAALGLDPFMPDVLNARGEMWRGKSERPRAIADFGAALRIDPQHAAARANYKSLAQEIERLGVGAPAKRELK